MRSKSNLAVLLAVDRSICGFQVVQTSPILVIPCSGTLVLNAGSCENNVTKFKNIWSLKQFFEQILFYKHSFSLAYKEKSITTPPTELITFRSLIHREIDTAGPGDHWALCGGVCRLAVLCLSTSIRTRTGINWFRNNVVDRLMAIINWLKAATSCVPPVFSRFGSLRPTDDQSLDELHTRLRKRWAQPKNSSPGRLIVGKFRSKLVNSSVQKQQTG